MNEKKDLPQRKPVRWKGFDYSSVGTYFLTVCTEERKEILSTVGGDVLGAPKNVELLPCGRIAEKYIIQMSNFYENITVDAYVIMPNHIHLLLTVQNGAPRTSPPTRQHSAVSQFISTFKRFCNKEFGNNIWQRHFYDHIIRNREDYEEHLRYIRENPMRWYYDELFSEQ